MDEDGVAEGAVVGIKIAETREGHREGERKKVKGKRGTGVPRHGLGRRREWPGTARRRRP